MLSLLPIKKTPMPYAGVIIQSTANSDWLKDPFENVQMDINVEFGSSIMEPNISVLSIKALKRNIDVFPHH